MTNERGPYPRGFRSCDSTAKVCVSCRTRDIINPNQQVIRRMESVPMREVSSDIWDRVNSNPLKSNSRFGSTSLQEPTGINGIEFPENVWDQSVEDKLEFLARLLKRIGHSEEDRVQS